MVRWMTKRWATAAVMVVMASQCCCCIMIPGGANLTQAALNSAWKEWVFQSAQAAVAWMGLP